MDSRIEQRKKEFKKTFDDPRRRREEQQVQIRKQTRDARLAKKRQQALETLDSGGAPASGMPAGGGGLIGEGFGPLSLEKQRGAGATAVDIERILELAQAIHSTDHKEAFQACQDFRRLLSIEKNPPIQEVIDAGVVPQFVRFLADDSRQELQFEAAWALTNIASGNHDQTAAVVQMGSVPIFVRLLSSPKDEVREQAVWALGNIAGDGPTFRDMVLEQGGLSPLLEQLALSMNDPLKITMLRNAAWALSNLCRGKPRSPFHWVSDAIPILRSLVFSNDVEVLTDACWAISYLSDGNDKVTQQALQAIVNTGIAPRLVELLEHGSFTVQTPALRAVGNIVSGDESQTQAMIRAGCIPALRVLLASSKKIICKEACWTISNITAGTDAQIEDVIRADIIPTLIDIVTTNADAEIRREAAWAIANAASAAKPEQLDYLLQQRALPALVEAIRMSDMKLVQVALEALENVLRTGQCIQAEHHLPDNPYRVAVEEANGYPALEHLQYAPENSKVYQLACQIMYTYLSYDDTEDLDDNPGLGGMADTAAVASPSRIGP